MGQGDRMMVGISWVLHTATILTMAIFFCIHFGLLKTMLFQCDGGVVPTLNRVPDVSYTPGNLQSMYDSSTTTSMIQLTFAYSGMGDGGEDDPNHDIISFEAALYAYSFKQEKCLFDTPISVTAGASLVTDPPTMPFPIVQPVDTSTIMKPRVTLQLPNTVTLDTLLFEPNIPCIPTSPACRRVSFCLQLQVLVCGVLIDFVDVNAKTEFDIVDCGDGGECLQVRPFGDPIAVPTPTAVPTPSANAISAFFYNMVTMLLDIILLRN